MSASKSIAAAALAVMVAGASANDCGLADVIAEHRTPHVHLLPAFPEATGSIRITSHSDRHQSGHPPVHVIGIDREGDCFRGGAMRVDGHDFSFRSISAGDLSTDLGFTLFGSQWYVVSTDRELTVTAHGISGGGGRNHVEARRYHVPGGIRPPRHTTLGDMCTYPVTLEPPPVAGLALEVIYGRGEARTNHIVELDGAITGLGGNGGEIDEDGNILIHWPIGEDANQNPDVGTIAVRWVHHDGRRGPALYCPAWR